MTERDKRLWQLVSEFAGWTNLSWNDDDSLTGKMPGACPDYVENYLFSKDAFEIDVLPKIRTEPILGNQWWNSLVTMIGGRWSVEATAKEYCEALAAAKGWQLDTAPPQPEPSHVERLAHELRYQLSDIDRVEILTTALESIGLTLIPAAELAALRESHETSLRMIGEDTEEFIAITSELAARDAEITRLKRVVENMKAMEEVFAPLQDDLLDTPSAPASVNVPVEPRYVPRFQRGVVPSDHVLVRDAKTLEAEVISLRAAVDELRKERLSGDSIEPKPIRGIGRL